MRRLEEKRLCCHESFDGSGTSGLVLGGYWPGEGIATEDPARRSLTVHSSLA